MILRDYQRAAVESTWAYLRAQVGNPAIVLPTGAGKTIVIAEIVREAINRVGIRVLVLAHVKELIEQGASALAKIIPDVKVGVYSAGLSRKEAAAPVVVAGIQSAYNQADKLCEVGPIGLVLVDEAHMIPPDGEGMYQRLLGDLKKISPHMRIVGLTATPYRLSSGEICGPDNMLNEIAYEVGVKQLIASGYLSPLISKIPIAVDTSNLHVRGGEFVADEAAALMADVVSPACREIVARTSDRRSVIIFGQNVEHAQKVKEELQGLDPAHRVEMITGDTPARERDQIIAEFKSGAIKYLTNINVLTTGFDAPGVDCVALLRPTLSAGLYYQSVGRGFRLSPGTGKTNCLVLDFAGNIRRHGPVDLLKGKPGKKGEKSEGGESPVKECPTCQAIIHAAFSNCPGCGHEFPANEVKHAMKPESAGVLSGEIEDSTYAVVDVGYAKHVKRGDLQAPPTLRVDYYTDRFGTKFSEWVCIEHPAGSYAQSKAKGWWAKRSNDRVPTTVDRALDIAHGGGLAIPLEIVVRKVSGEKFPAIHEVTLGELPAAIPVDPDALDTWDFPGKAELNAKVAEADNWQSPTYGQDRVLTDAELDEIPF